MNVSFMCRYETRECLESLFDGWILAEGFLVLLHHLVSPELALLGAGVQHVHHAHSVLRLAEGRGTP